MRVGIAYDLREDYLAEGYGEEETAEFDKPDTIEAIRTTLESLGYETDRIGHVRHLVARLAAGDRWDMVFNIAEGLAGYGREAQVPALLDAYGICYTFSDPMVLSLTLHKGMTKRVIRDMGIPTADFAVVESMEEIERVDLPFPLFAKPGGGGDRERGSPLLRKSLPRRRCRLPAEGSLRSIANPCWWRLSFPAGNSRSASSAQGKRPASWRSWKCC